MPLNNPADTENSENTDQLLLASLINNGQVVTNPTLITSWRLTGLLTTSKGRCSTRSSRTTPPLVESKVPKEWIVGLRHPPRPHPPASTRDVPATSTSGGRYSWV